MENRRIPPPPPRPFPQKPIIQRQSQQDQEIMKTQKKEEGTSKGGKENQPEVKMGVNQKQIKSSKGTLFGVLAGFSFVCALLSFVLMILL